jgi:GNAT superfamily N-acetyltransferase
MLTQHIVSIADTYWAAHLGCSPATLFAEPFHVITHGGELTGYEGAFALFRNGSTIASLPPDRTETLRALLPSDSLPCTPARFAAALAPMAVAIIGPAYIGYATAIHRPMDPVRALTVDDANALRDLRMACDPMEWEHGGSSIEQPCSGVFLHERLVALAGYEIWGGTIAHISIISHRDFRGRGYGRTAVAHLAERALTAGLVPQYRTLESNQPSIRIAESLGFCNYATSMAVRL